MNPKVENHLSKPFITIKNVGPIQSAELELNQVNVFIGPQSSGKSTIAKVISFCSWVEKDYILNFPTYGNDETFSKDLLKKFKDFHRLSDEYFSKDSFISYKTKTFEMEWHLLMECKLKVTPTPDANFFQNKKIAFIPAERNFVSAINVDKYSSSPNNITNFINDWYTAKSEFNSKESGLNMPLIDADYYFDEQQRKDWIIMNKAQKEIPLMSASSGFQSIVPLLVLMQYFTKTVYEKERSISPIEKHILKWYITQNKQQSKLSESAIKDFLQGIDKLETLPLHSSEKEITDFSENWEKLVRLTGIDIVYAFTRFIIEEPEQNLFPRTQRDLIYQLLYMIQKSGHEHELVITTHSPYILYALNNCMLGALVKDKMEQEAMDNLNCKDSLIAPSKVSAYQIKEGKIISLQNEDGLIGDNFLDANMKEIMDDFYSMIDYYGEDEDDE